MVMTVLMMMTMETMICLQPDCQEGASTRGVAKSYGRAVSSGHQVLDVSNHRQVHVGVLHSGLARCKGNLPERSSLRKVVEDGLHLQPLADLVSVEDAKNKFIASENAATCSHDGRRSLGRALCGGENMSLALPEPIR